MRVYHGSTIEVPKPDVSHSKRYLDFSPGFYLTTIQVQAEKWALRKALRFGLPAFVSMYDLDDELIGFRNKEFVHNMFVKPAIS